MVEMGSLEESACRTNCLTSHKALMISNNCTVVYMWLYWPCNVLLGGSASFLPGTLTKALDFQTSSQPADLSLLTEHQTFRPKSLSSAYDFAPRG